MRGPGAPGRRLTLACGRTGVAVHLAGSPLWSDPDQLLPALLQLKGLVRSAMAVAIVTVPAGVLAPGTLASVRRTADAALALEGFAGTPLENNAALREFHGLVRVRKLPRLQVLAPPQPETLDLAFKLKRKTLVLERLHLPPDLADNTARSLTDAKPRTSTPLCHSAPGKPSPLDF